MKAEHERLLERVVLGELARDDPEVVTAARDDGEFAQELEATLDVVSGLDDLAGEQDEVIAEAAGAPAAPAAPGEDRIVELVRRRVAPGPGGRSLAPWVLVAAAVLLVAVGLWWLPPGDDELTDIPLEGNDGIECIAPIGLVPSFERFEWRAAYEDGWYVVDIIAEGVTIDESDEIYGELHWEPKPEERRSWPDDIVWEVRWHDASGEIRDRDDESASRRP